jgi:O-methyltransferase
MPCRRSGAAAIGKPVFNSVVRAVRRSLRWRLAWVQRDYHATQTGSDFDYESVIRNQAYAPWRSDAEFQASYRAARARTLVDEVRCYELWDLVGNLRDIPGCIVEVGVWRGGTGSIMARALALTKPHEKIYLCDTFRGVVKAGDYDSTYRGGEHADSDASKVREFLLSMSLRNAVVLEGMFPDDTAEKIPFGPVSLCHIDVDVYQSAKETVEWADPRLPVGGVLAFDDYGFPTCIGVTRLVNELKATHRWTAIYNLNGHAILIKR